LGKYFYGFIDMKTTFLSFASLFIAFSMAGHNKINDEGWQIIQSYKAAHDISAQSTSSPIVQDVNDTYCVLATLDENTTAADLENKGYHVFKQRGNMVLMDIPTADIEEFADNDFVEAVSFGIKAVPLNDVARSYSNVNDVHSGVDLPQAYTGQGVITGIFDVGVDPNHVALYNADGTENRVKALYQVFSSGSSADKSYLTASDIANFTTDTNSGTHGAHTSAIMAGGYKGSVTYPYYNASTYKFSILTDALPYYGVCPESDIVMACGSSDTNSILRSFEYMINYAKNQNKPLVINLSFGINVGPHDGTTAFNQYVSELSKDAIICMAAGNEADSKIALTKTFTAQDNELKSFFTAGTSDSPAYYYRYADIWSNKSTAPKVKLVIYDTEAKSILWSQDWTSGKMMFIGGSGTNYTQPEVFVNNFSSNSILGVYGRYNTSNSRYEVLVYNSLVNSTSNSGNIVAGFIISDEAGTRIDGAIGDYDGSGVAFSNYGVEGWDDGGGDGSISDLACGDNIVSVGAYTSRSSWFAFDGYIYSYTQDSGCTTVGDISGYSSYGTRIDGTKLPLICAPGSAIISAFNSYYTDNQASDKTQSYQAMTTFNNRTYYWATSQGTSMACPHVAGIIGLWLQANPSLTVADVRDLLVSTATIDDQVTAAQSLKASATTGDNQATTAVTPWGASGKVNAYAGLKKILTTTAIGDITNDDQNRLLISRSAENLNVVVAGEGRLTARLFSASGLQVASTTVSSNELNLDVSSASPGFYVLDVVGDNAHYVKKIVIRK
jgi:subtilisin family serine protease